MNPFTDGQYTAYIGLDWADAKHDICLQAEHSDQREFECIAHRVDDIEHWALALHKRFWRAHRHCPGVDQRPDRLRAAKV